MYLMCNLISNLYIVKTFFHLLSPLYYLKMCSKYNLFVAIRLDKMLM